MFKAIRKKLIMIRESTAMALDNIRSNKVRSFLTLLGIMIGVMAVITLISTVSGVSGTISSSFSSMGVGTLTVNVTGSDLKSGVTPEDLEVITALENVDGVVPSVSLNGRVSYGSVRFIVHIYQRFISANQSFIFNSNAAFVSVFSIMDSSCGIATAEEVLPSIVRIRVRPSFC